MRQSIAYALIAMFLLFQMHGCINQSQQTIEPRILTFDDCVSAGNPILESYPRQCRMPDGRTLVSQKDVFDIGMDISCGYDADCLLVNSELGFSCCFAGNCEKIDYSEVKWIAVNRAWFGSGRIADCPHPSECGSGPLCFPKPINQNYTARCIGRKCQKAPK